MDCDMCNINFDSKTESDKIVLFYFCYRFEETDSFTGFAKSLTMTKLESVICK